MKILTLGNQGLNLDTLPEALDEDIRFAVLDNSNPLDPDFMFIPLIFMESFNAPAMVMKIAGMEIAMPVDWSILVGCSDTGADLEVIPLTSINNRGFEAFLYNPLGSFRLDYGEIDIINYYADVKWFFPKIRNGHILTIPLESKPNPICAYFVKDINKASELIDHSLLV